ncbi:MAG: hypothetical protein LUF00_13325 [Lachnospiraceae bacterium]|nr:hypothetical protein [Lachnospiraceae bacterium]
MLKDLPFIAPLFSPPFLAKLVAESEGTQMKKHIVLAAGIILAAALLTACSEQADTENTSVSSSGVTWEQTENAKAADEEDEATESQTHPSSTGTEEGRQSESEPQKGSAAVQTQPEESEESTAWQEKESQIAEQTVPESPTESAPSEATMETELPPLEATVPQTEPATEPTAELPTEPESEAVVTEPETEPIEAEGYDIEAHLSFARSYAESIGLILDSTAVDCWDNPISANPNLSNVDENITSRLNRYKNVEGFTAVWIWAVQVSENGYAIYIGYA